MWASLQAPLFFGLIAAFVTTLGLLAVALRADWSEKNASLFGLAAGGMLTAIALLHILPEAFHLSSNAPVWLTVGFFGGLVLNLLVRAVFPESETSTLPREAITPIVAIAIHSTIDGVVYAVTFAASFSAGVFASLGLIMHEFPEGVIAFAILRRHGVSNRNAFIWAFLASALTTPVGVILSAPFIAGFDADLIGLLFALSAGLLLYVATGPLMSPLSEQTPAKGLGAVTAGAGFAIFLMFAPIPGMDHDHSHDLHDHGSDMPRFDTAHPHDH